MGEIHGSQFLWSISLTRNPGDEKEATTHHNPGRNPHQYQNIRFHERDVCKHHSGLLPSCTKSQNKTTESHHGFHTIINIHMTVLRMATQHKRVRTHTHTPYMVAETVILEYFLTDLTCWPTDLTGLWSWWYGNVPVAHSDPASFLPVDNQHQICSKHNVDECKMQLWC